MGSGTTARSKRSSASVRSTRRVLSGAFRIVSCRDSRPGNHRDPESRAHPVATFRCGGSFHLDAHTLIPAPSVRGLALGPWGSFVYPWWFGTTRLRFKSGRTHTLTCPESISVTIAIVVVDESGKVACHTKRPGCLTVV